MNKWRFSLIIAITLLVMTTVIATRLYEFIVLTESPKEAVVRAGYQKFRKATNGFNFRYPMGWRYEQQIANDDFINGFFYNQNGEAQLYLESPYSAHEFIFSYQQAQPYYSPAPIGQQFPVVAVSSSIFLTNDPSSPIIFNIYRPCVFNGTSTSCVAADRGGFITGVWQRGKAYPVLSEKNESTQTGVLYTILPADSNQEQFKINQFISILRNFRFNNITDSALSTSTRWLAYHNAQYSYSINYPKFFTVSENIDLSFVLMSTGTVIDFPSSMLSGTNLSEAKILIGPVKNEFVGPNCLPENGISTPPEQVSINGNKYFKSIGAGAAAGNRYDTITYASNRGGVCFNITLFLHSTVLENYPEEARPKAFNKDEILANFSAIFNTFFND